MTSRMDLFYDWLQADRDASQRDGQRRPDLQRYFRGISKARYVIRTVFRLVDEQARKAGLEPLEHQALIQIFGGEDERLRVNDVADRLDIPAALASRVARSLVDKGLVERTPSETDRRAVHLATSIAGREVLAGIDEQVHLHVEHFQRQLDPVDRAAALAIFAFYVGASPGLQDFNELERLVR